MVRIINIIRLLIHILQIIFYSFLELLDILLVIALSLCLRESFHWMGLAVRVL